MGTQLENASSATKDAKVVLVLLSIIVLSAIQDTFLIHKLTIVLNVKKFQDSLLMKKWIAKIDAVMDFFSLKNVMMAIACLMMDVVNHAK